MKELIEAINKHDLTNVKNCFLNADWTLNINPTELREAFDLALTLDNDDIADYLLDKVDELNEVIASHLQAAKRKNVEADEPIAVIGMSCRFPGGANNIDAYWRILHEGIDTITDVPEDRWDVNQYYDANPQTLNKMVTRSGGFLTQSIQDIDAAFFRISPREAEMMDPQQRLLLEVVWEALENANIDPASLRESLTGMYTGICSHDYNDMLIRAGEVTHEALHNIYLATGNASSAASGRISYFLGLEGPNLSIDTACSSSLVSVHQACQSLRVGESKLALAAGVNVLLSPDVSINFSKANMLSPDGHCKTFDSKANGYARGEGCGVLVLKRLSDAEADGDYIHAVIRGSAVNQDGASSGLTTPNGPAQERLIRKALDQAQLNADAISYIEAHGTGTELGDPIEVRALGNVYGEGRDEANSFVLGTAKVNIGHLEGAAGIAGLIKVILALKNQMLPPHRNFVKINPKIDLAAAKAKVITQPQSWPRTEHVPRIAGVSSFGFSGTNAHIIVSESAQEMKQDYKIHPRPIHLLSISAKSSEALQGLVKDYIHHFEQHPELRVEDVCYTSNVSRSHFDYRLAVPLPRTSNMTEAASSLNEQLHALPAVSTSGARKLAFLFSGQGSQWVGMAQDWYQNEPVFRDTFDACLLGFSAILGELIDTDHLRDLVVNAVSSENNTERSSALNKTLYTQIALFCFEYALAVWWKSVGLTPQAVMGHSIGECVAAVVVGVMSLEDGITLVAHRARLMEEIKTAGAMVAIQASKEVVEKLLETYKKAAKKKIVLDFAADNSPNQVVLSGTTEAVDDFIRTQLDPEKIRCTRLNVSNAFHSPLMLSMVSEFRKVTESLTYHAPTCTLISNVTGRAISEPIDAQYWINHVLQSVRCREGFQALNEAGMVHFLELGPRPLLTPLGQQTIKESKNTLWLCSVNSRDNSPANVPYIALAKLYEAGYSLNWTSFHSQQSLAERHKVELPTYHFIRHRHWPKALDALIMQRKSADSKESKQLNADVDCEVLIIGGGAAGLSALGRLKAGGHQNVMLLERENSVGGVWSSTQYPGVSIQSKNFSYKFFDFYAPKSTGEHASAEDIVKYFLEYIEHNKLQPNISLSKTVKKIVYHKDNEGAHRCTVSIEDSLTGEASVLRCSYVICAMGFSSAGVINKPQFSGLDDFTGKVVHSSEFNQAMLDDIQHNNKKVCILGAGKSAYDLALRTSKAGPGNITWVYDKFLWGLNYDFIYSASIAELRKVTAMYAEYEKFYKVDPHGQRTRDAAKGIVETGYLINMEEGNFDIYQSRSAIYKKQELAELKNDVTQVKSKVKNISENRVELNNGESITADYLICATGYQHASNLPVITILSGDVETIYDMREVSFLFRSMIDPDVPRIIMFTGQTLFPQQLLIYSIVAEWLCRYIDDGLSRQYDHAAMAEEISQDFKEHGYRYTWHPDRSTNQSQGARYIIDSPFFYFKRVCGDMGLAKTFAGEMGLAIANEEKFVELSSYMQQMLLHKVDKKIKKLSANSDNVNSKKTVLSEEKKDDSIICPLVGMDNDERMSTIKTCAATILKQILHFSIEDEIDINVGFEILGMDSVMFSEFKSSLEKTLQVELGNKFYNCANLSDIIMLAMDSGTNSENRDFDTNAKRDFDRLTAEEKQAYYDRFANSHSFLKKQGFKSYTIKGSQNIATEVYSSGSGETVVLLPPLNCSVSAWRYQIMSLIQNYRVISLHYPGYGRSDFDPDAVKIETISDNFFEVLNIILNGQPFHLVGWSFGGHVALPYAKKYPETLLSLTLVCTTACLESMYNLSNYGVFNTIMKGLVDDFDLSYKTQLLTSSMPMSNINDLKGTYGIHTFMHYARAVTLFDYRDQVKNIDIPTQVIAGAEDKLTIPSYMKFIAENIKNSRYFELENAGHYLPLFYPEYFNKQLLQFISQHSLTSATTLRKDEQTLSDKKVTMFYRQINPAVQATTPAVQAVIPAIQATTSAVEAATPAVQVTTSAAQTTTPENRRSRAGRRDYTVRKNLVDQGSPVVQDNPAYIPNTPRGTVGK